MGESLKIGQYSVVKVVFWGWAAYNVLCSGAQALGDYQRDLLRGSAYYVTCIGDIQKCDSLEGRVSKLRFVLDLKRQEYVDDMGLKYKGCNIYDVDNWLCKDGGDVASMRHGKYSSNGPSGIIAYVPASAFRYYIQTITLK